MKKSIVVAGVVFFVFCMLFTPMAHAAYYMGVIKNVATRPPSGDTIIQVAPGAGETRFVDDPARIKIDNSDPGANKALATVLTALSLGYEIQFQVDLDPSWATIQSVKSVSVSAP